MAFPQSFLDELIARSDIVDVVSSYVQLTRKGSNLFGLCPFHSEKTGSFTFSCSRVASRVGYPSMVLTWKFFSPWAFIMKSSMA